MKRFVLCLAALFAFVVGVLVVNRVLTNRYRIRYEASSDLLAIANFLGQYAAEHSDSLPESWDQLRRDGFLAEDPKLAIRFARYGENALHHPERIQWLPSANLKDYALGEEGAIRTSDGSRVRLIWVVGTDPAHLNEKYYVKLMLSVWAECRREGNR